MSGGGRWRGMSLNVNAKSGWRARGFEDGSAGRPKRSTADMGGDVNVAAYLEGYRIGKRERDRAK